MARRLQTVWVGLLLFVVTSDWVTCGGPSSVLKFYQQPVDDRSSDNPNVKSIDLDVTLDRKSGSYSVWINNQQWLTGSSTFLTVDGRILSNSDDGGLKLVSVRDEDGIDNLGKWQSTVLVFAPSSKSGSSTTMEAIFKRYQHLPNAYLFGQRFPDGVNGSSIGNKNAVSTGFPTFVTTTGSSPLATRLGYVAYGGYMLGDTEKRVGIWDVAGIKQIASGLDSGPLILFAEDSKTSLIISTFSSFMSSSVQYKVSDDGKMATASWGTIGTSKELPRDFTLWTVIVGSELGINKVVTDWGELLRYNYRRGTEYRDSDMTNNYIGYYTDNGAYYYYLTENGTTYENTLIDVHDYAVKKNIPYRYVQYDSWWYYKSPDESVQKWPSYSTVFPQDGTYKWAAIPTVFPDGIQYLWNKTGWTAVAHNRWWSDTVVYAKQNGGKYNFIVERNTQKSLPVEQRFWLDLFSESRKWGLIVYEQDWLNDQFNEMEATVSQVGVGREWLLQMGQAARETGLTLQYCMSTSRHALQTLEIPVVSQIRVSDDYQPGNDQWKIGISSMLAHALGIAPFKDNFWTTNDQQGNKYNLSEPYPALQAVVATLSTGPVAPSDKIGHTDVELLARSCNAEGLILKPSKPATATDLQMHLTAFKHFTGEIWSTYSDISEWRFGIVFAADFATGDSIVVGPREAGFDFEQFPSPNFAFSWFDSERKLVPFATDSPLTLSKCTKSQFCLYLISPTISVGSEEFIIYGELAKWVPVSPQRITRIATVHSHGPFGDYSDVEVYIRGTPDEHVVFSVGRLHGPVLSIDCRLSAYGTAKLSVARAICHHE